MDIEVLRAANAFWLHTLDWQIPSMRAIAWPSNASPAQPGVSTGPRPVPMLNWPPTLFADDIRYH